MTVHPRRDWTTTPPANANPFDESLIKGLAVHWNGPPVPASTLTNPRAYLEGVRRFHVGSNGWSDIAYNYAVDQTGNVWVLRGMRHMSGANGDNTVNARWLAVLAIIGVGQEPTPKLLDGLRVVAGMVRAEYPRAHLVTTHQAIRPESTACPGTHLIRAVADGRVEPDPGLPEVSAHFMRNAWERDRRRKTGLHPIQTRRVQRALGFQLRTGRWGRATRARFGKGGPTEATLRALGGGKFRVVP